MEFLRWHYTLGVRWYLKRWVFLLGWVAHYFSLTLLIPTLFAPWKRLTDDENYAGFNPQKYFRRVTFNLISRGIGAIVRMTLFIAGTLTLIPAFFAGFAGLIFWLLLPDIGLPYYLFSEKFGQVFYDHLAQHLASSPQTAPRVLLDTAPGKFLLTHTGQTAGALLAVSDSAKLSLAGFRPVNFSRLIDRFIDSGVWPEVRLMEMGVTSENLKAASAWWDLLHLPPKDEEKLSYSRPGIGLELLFGYTPQLNQYSSDLSAPREFSHHLVGRQEVVSRIERSLSGGSSVILVGMPGVGKKTVLLEFARRAAAGELGPKLAYQRVLEFDYNFLLSESIDLNQKKATLSRLFSESSSAGNIVLVFKDLHRLTNHEVEGVDFTDLFEKYLEKRTLRIIAISSRIEYERFISQNSRLRKFFEIVEATPPTKEQALEILFDSAAYWERHKHMIITVQALTAILEGSDRYITDTPFPEKALEILDQALAYSEQQKIQVITPEEVNLVIGERTGIPFARLTEKEKNILSNLESAMHEGLVGQDAAVSLISKSLRAASVNVRDESRPLGSFLFLGPTGVGKTQTAKVLARIYYGSEKEILRFDMAQYAGQDGVSRLIGSASRNQPGILTTAIKNKPASLLLLDEIEKAPPQVYNLFLTLLDEGFITDAQGQKIICRHLFVIATSNAGAEFIRQQVLSGADGSSLQQQVVEHVLQNRIFSPEFLNRFDGVVVYTPLSRPELLQVARLMLTDLVASLQKKNIRLEITDELAQKVSSEGYQPELGARPMRRIVDLTLGDLLGSAILKEEIKSGDKVKIIPGNAPDTYSLQILNGH